MRGTARLTAPRRADQAGHVAKLGSPFALAFVVACGADPRATTGMESSDGSGASISTSSPSSTSAQTTADASSGGSSSSSSTDASSDESSAGASSSTGEPPAHVCSSVDLLGCQRGMYLSLYTDHTGQIDFGRETEQHRFILGDAAKEQLVLDFVEAHRIESLALYDLATILDDPALQDALQSFMGRAREAGVQRIEAIGATATSTWDAIAEFHDTHAAFDGMVTEIEFWNGSATFMEFLDILGYARDLGLVAPSGEPATLSVYVGWLEQAEVDAMLPLVDRAYVHTYVDDASTAFGYGEERFAMYADANLAQGLAVEVRPIFSAEDNAWSAGAETFMGEWLADHGLDAAELAMLEAFEGSSLHGRIQLSGHQYFSYFFLERYVD